MKRTAKILLIGSALIALAAMIYALLRLPQLPDDLNRIALGRPTKIYDDSGRLIRIMANRQIVPLSQISPYMIQAVL
ncbi:MAG: penicillin-binding protein, partial [candidate division KSB1 bacterium]|nr:penicillin-binding protein [candidate division KSB1 bacterium]